MPKKLVFAFLLAGPMVLASCGDNPLGPSDLAGEWRLRSVTPRGGSTVTISSEGPTRFSVRFAADGNIALRVDCNGCGGSYQLRGESLTSGPFACTLMLCAGPGAGSEFVDILDGRSSVDLEGRRLTVSSDRGTAVFER